jgi:hypothetical protein
MACPANGQIHRIRVHVILDNLDNHIQDRDRPALQNNRRRFLDACPASLNHDSSFRDSARQIAMIVSITMTLATARLKKVRQIAFPVKSAGWSEQ